MSTAETTKQPAVTNGIDGLVRTYKRVRRFILASMCLLLPLPIVFPYLAYVLAFRYTFPGSDLLALLAFRAWLWASNRFCQCFGRIPGEGGQLYRDLRRGIIRPARKRTNWKMLYIVHILDALADLDIAWCGGTGMSAVWSGSGGYPGGRKQAAAAAVRRLARLG